MNTLKKEQKTEAISRLKMLIDLPNPIKEFEENNTINMSEGPGILYWLDEEEKEMVKEFEKDYDATVYHIIHSYTNIGELYTLLFVSKYKEDWDMEKNGIMKGNMSLAYVVNKDMPDCSEFGHIGLDKINGGLKRIW